MFSRDTRGGQYSMSSPPHLRARLIKLSLPASMALLAALPIHALEATLREATHSGDSVRGGRVGGEANPWSASPLPSSKRAHEDKYRHTSKSTALPLNTSLHQVFPTYSLQAHAWWQQRAMLIALRACTGPHPAAAEDEGGDAREGEGAFSAAATSPAATLTASILPPKLPTLSARQRRVRSVAAPQRCLPMATTPPPWGEK